MNEDWSDWIEHVGGGCPLPVGTMVHREFDGVVGMIEGQEVQATRAYTGPITEAEWDSWIGRDVVHPLGRVAQVVRYRIWRPRAVQMLIRIARLPEKVENHAE